MVADMEWELSGRSGIVNKIHLESCEYFLSPVRKVINQVIEWIPYDLEIYYTFYTDLLHIVLTYTTANNIAV